MRQVLIFIVSACGAGRRAISVFLAQAKLEALVFNLAGSVSYRRASRVTTVVAVVGLESSSGGAIVVVARHGSTRGSCVVCLFGGAVQLVRVGV
jgi:hypothetical protein